MRVKPVIPGAVIRDPHTKQQLPAEGGDVPDGDTFWTRRFLAGEVWRLEGEEWVRRLSNGELVRERVATPATATAPLGNEPIAPLTTRSTR